MRPEKEIWFREKRLGFGWGAPVHWKGWLVLLAYGLLMSVGSALLHRTRYPGTVLPYMTALTGILILICIRKGGPPRDDP
ncbi:MAG TPA: hypothetical protein VMD31_13385 [Opitutaceae bacterium]|nr:hypothetical protein [Opitutaceae bacterium]